MHHSMLILLLLILSPALLVCAICFLMLWHKAHRAGIGDTLHENRLCHIGISVGIIHPTDHAPIYAALESRYPLYEVVVVVDLEHTALQDIVKRYHLVRVNSASLLNGLEGVRAMFRSYFRPHQQVVLLDASDTSAANLHNALRRVASYPYLMTVNGCAILRRDSITQVANTIALYPLDEPLSLRTIVGARVDVRHIEPTAEGRLIIFDNILAFGRGNTLITVATLATPIIPIALSLITGEIIALLPAIAIVLVELMLIYLSCRVVVEKSLFATFGMIIADFYRFLVGDMRVFCYLYKRSEGCAPKSEFCTPISVASKLDNSHDRRDPKLPAPTRLQRRRACRCRDYEGVSKQR